MQWIGNSKTESQGDLRELKQMVYTKVHKRWSVKMLIKSCPLSSYKQGTWELSSPCANPIDDYCHGAINERAKASNLFVWQHSLNSVDHSTIHYPTTLKEQLYGQYSTF